MIRRTFLKIAGGALTLVGFGRGLVEGWAGDEIPQQYKTALDDPDRFAILMKNVELGSTEKNILQIIAKKRRAHVWRMDIHPDGEFDKAFQINLKRLIPLPFGDRIPVRTAAGDSNALDAFTGGLVGGTTLFQFHGWPRCSMSWIAEPFTEVICLPRSSVGITARGHEGQKITAILHGRLAE